MGSALAKKLRFVELSGCGEAGVVAQHDHWL